MKRKGVLEDASLSYLILKCSCGCSLTLHAYFVKRLTSRPLSLTFLVYYIPPFSSPPRVRIDLLCQTSFPSQQKQWICPCSIPRTYSVVSSYQKLDRWYFVLAGSRIANFLESLQYTLAAFCLKLFHTFCWHSWVELFLPQSVFRPLFL